MADDITEQRQVAFNKAIGKARGMTDGSLLAVWKSLGNSYTWGDGYYNQYITMEEWADLVYSEITRRGIRLNMKIAVEV